MDELSRLLVEARDGDDVALAAFVRRSQSEVWRLCSYLVDAAAADDLCQEVYLRAWGAMPAYRGDASARTWLLSITRRTCAGERRRRSRIRRLVTRLAPEGPSPGGTGLVEIDGLMRGLDPERRAAFLLTQWFGLSYAEAAEVCGCRVGTIRSRVARARLQLIGQMEARADDISE